MKLRTKIDAAILLIVVVIGMMAIPRSQDIGDWWHFRNYSPPNEIAAIADESGMNETGKKLFYRFSPEIITSEKMSEKCDIVRLGCIEGRYIYILESDDPADLSNAIVTASHEMLHVAYDRLTDSEKDKLHRLIDRYLKETAGNKILTKLGTYPAEDYYNEAHSFLGSEEENLPANLESHYRRYFSDRQKTVSAFKNSPEARH